MASEAKEGWEGGEVLFAGGTDWAKVLSFSAVMHNAFAVTFGRRARMAVLFADCSGRKQQEAK